MAVEVNLNATVDRVELSLAFSDCGLMYTNMSQCPRGELRLTQLRGSVMDAGGASIANADIADIAPSEPFSRLFGQRLY